MFKLKTSHQRNILKFQEETKDTHFGWILICVKVINGNKTFLDNFYKIIIIKLRFLK